ncbi:MAG: hypothetical protein II309_00175 [Bacilli bacterium]|jgi:bifunctional UDP-N-acetylglucosamine pyrophosphorylase/glucosamine-1-phosphate N-acetyltransferase|nr:hypothetical protein [Bacilli bacterium]
MKDKFIEENVVIEDGVVIEPFVKLLGNTVIKKGAVIKSFTEINNSIIGENTIVDSSTVLDSKIGNNNNIGPRAYIRNNTETKENAKVGFSVEVKNSIIGNNTKVSHLSYIGDSILGDNINIGAGTITANYDGINKNKTVIEDNCFIGSNTVLIAPIKIGKGSKVAAGSTLNQDVKPDSLAIARTRQITKENYYKNEII